MRAASLGGGAHVHLCFGSLVTGELCVTSSEDTMARMNRPAPVEVCYKNMRFLITHNPNNSTLSTFIEVRIKKRTEELFC